MEQNMLNGVCHLGNVFYHYLTSKPNKPGKDHLILAKDE